MFAIDSTNTTMTAVVKLKTSKNKAEEAVSIFYLNSSS